MSQQFDDALQKALDALSAGEPLEAVLSRYPDAADNLRPLLVAAAAVSQIQTNPQPVRQAESNRRLLAMAAQTPVRRAAPGILLRGLAGALAVPVLVVGVSLPSLPGEPLYGIKQAVDAARLAVATNQTSRDIVESDLQQERYREAKALIQSGQAAPIELTGLWGSAGPDQWSVGGLFVIIAEGVRLPERLQPGMMVRVTGRVENHNLRVTGISLIDAEPVMPAPPATLTPSQAGSPPAASSKPPPEIEKGKDKDDDGDNRGGDGSGDSGGSDESDG